MYKRRATSFRPILELLEEKQLLSESAPRTPVASPNAGLKTLNSSPPGTVGALAVKPNYGYLVYRITNPNSFNNHLTPPFTNVLVQEHQPVAGQLYNILYVAVRNGTAQTFDASSGLTVSFPGQHYTVPILSGSEQWKPGQEFVFYVLTKQYYPLPNVLASGFQFQLGGAKSVAIPGPSGIFLRVTYKPATFNHSLDSIVAYGPGAEGGAGIKYGLPDTAIYEFVSAKTQRRDFGGYF